MTDTPKGELARPADWRPSEGLRQLANAAYEANAALERAEKARNAQAVKECPVKVGDTLQAERSRGWPPKVTHPIFRVTQVRATSSNPENDCRIEGVQWLGAGKWSATERILYGWEAYRKVPDPSKPVAS